MWARGALSKRREFTTPPCKNAPVVVEWDDLRFLLAICECGSASSAGRKLAVDKATVVRRVSRLEEVLGVRLLVRKASGWSPTPAGRLTAGAARRIHGEIGALRSEFSDVKGAPRTQISVTAPHWFCSELLLPEVPRLIVGAPWIDLTVAATSRVLDLAQREADVAVRNSRPERGDFVVRRAGELGSTLYASRAYARKSPRSTAPPDWASHRFVGYADRLTYVPAFAWLDEAAGSGAGVTRRRSRRGRSSVRPRRSSCEARPFRRRGEPRNNLARVPERGGRHARGEACALFHRGRVQAKCARASRVRLASRFSFARGAFSGLGGKVGLSSRCGTQRRRARTRSTRCSRGSIHGEFTSSQAARNSVRNRVRRAA